MFLIIHALFVPHNVVIHNEVYIAQLGEPLLLACCHPLEEIVNIRRFKRNATNIEIKSSVVLQPALKGVVLFRQGRENARGVLVAEALVPPFKFEPIFKNWLKVVLGRKGIDVFKAIYATALISLFHRHPPYK